jgi:two-component system, OmpR family, response regulator ResD
MEDHSRGTVLVVDDEPTITEVVARYLERAGYRTRVAANGTQAIEMALSQRPDLVLLDLMLPGLDGLEVMRRLRELDRDRIAVILLTAKGDESDRVIGLRLGADDYVVKPFSPAELVARVDAVLRRMDTSPGHEAPIEFSDITIDPSSRQVFIGDDEVPSPIDPLG